MPGHGHRSVVGVIGPGVVTGSWNSTKTNWSLKHEELDELELDDDELLELDEELLEIEDDELLENGIEEELELGTEEELDTGIELDDDELTWRVRTG